MPVPAPVTGPERESFLYDVYSEACTNLGPGTGPPLVQKVTNESRWLDSTPTVRCTQHTVVLITVPTLIQDSLLDQTPV